MRLLGVFYQFVEPVAVEVAGVWQAFTSELLGQWWLPAVYSIEGLSLVWVTGFAYGLIASLLFWMLTVWLPGARR